MKRRTALRKVRTFCERLDALVEALPVRILSVHIFGSALTDKPAPADIDLLVEHRERPIMTEEEQEQILADLWCFRVYRSIACELALSRLPYPAHPLHPSQQILLRRLGVDHHRVQAGVSE